MANDYTRNRGKYIFTILIQSGQYIVHTRDVPINNSKLGVLKTR